MPSLAELAHLASAELDGDGGLMISAVATLKSAQPDEISFFTNRRYRAELTATLAGAVVLAPKDRQLFAGPCLLSDNPYLSFARVSAVLNPESELLRGVDSSARIDPSASVGSNVSIDSNVTIGADAVISADCIIAVGAVIGAGVQIGAGSQVGPHAVLMENTRLGARCRVSAGAVLGSVGFGYANDAGRWVPVPQLGRVWLGDDVDVGANTTIDRGALEDTVLERGVKLDNQIQIAHGVVIGEDTAIAACVGISGSTRIGKRCTIAGGVGFVGHLEIVDDVHITGMSMVTRSISKAGVYSGYPAETNDNWRKNTARFHKLDRLARKGATLERTTKE